MVYVQKKGVRMLFYGMSPAVKLLFVCLIILVFLFLSSFVAALAAVPIFGYSVFDLLDAISRPAVNDLAVMRYFQIIQSIFVFVIPSFLAAWLFSGDTFGYLHARSRPAGLGLLLVLCTVVVAIPFLNGITWMNAQLDLPDWLDSLEKRMISLEESAAHLTELFLQSHNYGDLMINLVMIAILPAIGEEFLFRGVFQRLFADWTKNAHLGVMLGAFIFSFFHFQFFGFLPRFLLGVYFGYLYVWSGTIWLPVAGHFINNGLAVAYYHFSTEQMGETLLDNIGTNEQGAFTLVGSIVLTTLLLYATFRLAGMRRHLTANHRSS